MSIAFDFTSFQNLDNLLRYQNHLLVRKIAQDKKWPLKELKKFIPNKVEKTTSSGGKKPRKVKSKASTSVDEPNFKVIQKKVVKKKIKKVIPPKKVKKTPVSESKNTLSDSSLVTPINEKETEKTKTAKPKKRVKKIIKKSSNTSEVVKPEESKKPTKKIKRKETNEPNNPNELKETYEPKEGEVEVMLIQINEQHYYLEPKTDKVYQKESDGLLIFVGMKEGNNVNLDAESAEE